MPAHEESKQYRLVKKKPHSPSKTPGSREMTIDLSELGQGDIEHLIEEGDSVKGPCGPSAHNTTVKREHADWHSILRGVSLVEEEETEGRTTEQKRRCRRERSAARSAQLSHADLSIEKARKRGRTMESGLGIGPSGG